jgi:hypothetical protein
MALWNTYDLWEKEIFIKKRKPPLVVTDCDGVLLDTFKYQAKWIIKKYWTEVSKLINPNLFPSEWDFYKDRNWEYDEKKHLQDVNDYMMSDLFCEIWPLDWALEWIRSITLNDFQCIVMTSIWNFEKVRTSRIKNLNDLFWSNTFKDIIFPKFWELKWKYLKEYLKQWEVVLIEDTPEQALDWLKVGCKSILLRSTAHEKELKRLWLENTSSWVILTDTWKDIVNILTWKS